MGAWITVATVEKLLKKNLSKIEPLVETNIATQLEMTKTLSEKITSTPDYKSDGKYFYEQYDNKGKVPYIKFQIISKVKEVNDVTLKILFNKKSELIITNASTDFYFRTLEDLSSLTMAFDKEYQLAAVRYAESQNNLIKRGKIKELKTKAIMAKIHEIAIEEGFEYLIESNFRTKIKLNIRVSKSDYMEINIPYTNFQEVLQSVKDVYYSIKSLFDNGISVKIRYSNYAQKMKWKTQNKEE